MRKIAFVASLSNRGGTELTLIQLLKEIPEKRYDITLFLIGNGGDLEKEIPTWITIRPVRSENFRNLLKKSFRRLDLITLVKMFWNKLRGVIYRWKYPARKFSLYATLMEQYEKIEDEYDVAIAWALPSAIENIFVLKNVNAKRKAMWVHMDVSKDKPPIDAEKYYLRFNDIFCVSVACKEKFDEVFPTCSGKTKVFYNLINKKKISEKANVPTLLDENVFKIMTCGRLSSEKQPLLAIEIVKKLLKANVRDFKWYFVGGGGNLQTELRNAIHRENLGSYIVLLGVQDNPYSYVGKADLYVQMSRHESFCLTLAEAQILGIPAISTNFPSAYEIIDHGRTGYIVKDDENALFDAIQGIMKNENRLVEMKSELKMNNTVPTGDVLQFERYVEKDD